MSIGTVICQRKRGGVYYLHFRGQKSANENRVNKNREGLYNDKSRQARIIVAYKSHLERIRETVWGLVLSLGDPFCFCRFAQPHLSAFLCQFLRARQNYSSTLLSRFASGIPVFYLPLLVFSVPGVRGNR